MTLMDEFRWNVDGHRINLTLRDTIVDVTPSICPHGGAEDAECYHSGIGGCLFKYFVTMYGLETNTGNVEAAPSVEMAWCKEGSDWEIDLMKFLMIPVNDPYFKDWVEAQRSQS